MNNYASGDFIEQYKAYVQDLGNIGVRYENSRRFYLSVASALFVFLSMAGKLGKFQAVQGPVLTLVGAAGVILCIVWVMHMQAFGAIFKAKFDVLRVMEDKHQLFHMFEEELKYLKANRRFILLNLIDSVPPLLFALLFVTLLLLK